MNDFTKAIKKYNECTGTKALNIPNDDKYDELAWKFSRVNTFVASPLLEQYSTYLTLLLQTIPNFKKSYNKLAFEEIDVSVKKLYEQVCILVQDLQQALKSEEVRKNLLLAYKLQEAASKLFNTEISADFHMQNTLVDYCIN